MYKLKYLKVSFDNLYEQGSKSWLEQRRNRIGGSEILEFLSCKNPTAIKKFKEKRLSNSCPKIFCFWGHAFEKVAKKYLETTGIVIHEFGAIPSGKIPVAYSPDGVYVDGEDLVLLEIKCPIYRNDLAIKDQYMHQIQTGMDIICCDYTSFIQFRFRKCMARQFNSLGIYDRKYHHECYKHRYPATPTKEIFKGFLWWGSEEDIVESNVLNSRPWKISIDGVLCTEKKGCVFYFKCFNIDEQKVMQKDILDYKAIWKQYKEFNDL
jgi:hypothetical protein